MAFSTRNVLKGRCLTLTPIVYDYHAKNTSIRDYYYSTVKVINPLKEAIKIPSMFDGKIKLSPGKTHSLYIYDHWGRLVYSSDTDNWAQGEGEEPIKAEESRKVDLKECIHVWKEYVGFTESYKFCTLCDAKKES